MSIYTPQHTSRYIEVDSTYRDRNTWPSASQFDVLLSHPRSGHVLAADPVSESAARVRWRGHRFRQFEQSQDVTGRVVDDALGTLSTNTTFILETGTVLASPPGSFQPTDDYYVGASIVYTNEAYQRARVVSYRYMGGNRAKITTDAPLYIFSPPPDGPVGPVPPVPQGPREFVISDPTDLTSADAPVFFVPASPGAENTYTGCILHNDTLDESRPVEGFDALTHTLTIRTDGSTAASGMSGPVTGWAPSHAYSVRDAAPLLCTTLENPTLSTTVFNLPDSTRLTNLENAFLELADDLTDGRDGGALQAVASAARVTLDVMASAVSGFYNGCTLRLRRGGAGDESRPIVGYDGATRVATLSPGYAAAPRAGTRYHVSSSHETRVVTRYVDYRGVVVPTAPASTTTLWLPRDASNDDRAYTGLYVRVLDGPAAGDTRAIQRYVVASSASGAPRKTATVSPPFTQPVAGGTAFSITSGMVSPPFTGSLQANKVCVLPYTRDNMHPFTYTGSQASQQEVVNHEIRLLHVVLPNAVLEAGQGRTVSKMPYVYVNLANMSGEVSGLPNVICSNNPNSTRMLFRAAIDDVSDRADTRFVTARGDMTQTIKFKPNDHLRFSVRLPNGDLLRTVVPDTYGPHPPNPSVQISAVFEIRRL